MAVHSVYHTGLENPDSARSIEDKRIIGHIKLSWLKSDSVYGYQRMTDDLRDLGETCGKHLVHRLIRQEKLRSQTSYRRRNSNRGGPAVVWAPNHAQRQFDVVEPHHVRLTDITDIRTYDGWLFLAIAIDFFSR